MLLPNATHGSTPNLRTQLHSTRKNPSHLFVIDLIVSQAKYLGNYWSSTKFCTTQFKGTVTTGSRADQSALNIAIAKSKCYDDVASVVGNDWSGEAEFEEIVRAIESRDGRIPRLSTTEASTTESAVATILPTESASSGSDVENQPDLAADRAEVKTPPTSRTPDSTLLRAPLVPANEALMPVPAFVLGRDVQTPTPMPLSTTTSVSEIGSQPQ